MNNQVEIEVHPEELTIAAPERKPDPNKKLIREEDKLHIQWFEEAANCTVDTLGDFVKHLINDYEHDYGTIVHAIAAAVDATITAMNKSDQGGITGFQAGCLMWEILERDFQITYPCALTRYEKMLYPQYGDIFTAITPDIWEWVRNKAKELLVTNNTASEVVRRHWKSIADGIIPFNYNVRVQQ